MLAFVWINNFMNIKGCGYNLHNSYDIETTDINNEYKIIIRERDTIGYKNGFFGNVVNVTSLVGENGTGKSNFFDFLKLVYSSSRIQTKFILIYQVDNDFVVYAYNFVDSDNITVESTELYNIKLFKQKFNSETVNKNNNIVNAPLVYYSDVYDYRNENEKFVLTNISTNYLTKAENYRFTEIKKQIKFISYNYLSDETTNKLKKPHVIKFGFTSFTSKKACQRTREVLNGEKPVVFNDVNKIVIRRRLQFDLINNSLIKQNTSLYKCIERIFDNLTRKEFYEKLNCNSLTNSEVARKGMASFIIHMLHNNFVCCAIDKIEEILIELSEINNFNEFENYLINTDINYNVRGSFTFSNSYTYITCYLDALKISQPFQENQIIFVEIPFDLSNNITKQLIDLDNVIRLEKTTFFIDMLDFSSGEKAQLNLYARLYDIRNNMSKHNSIIIIIDEAGLYYHPRWQIDFFDDLIKFLNHQYQNHEIQLLIATHSPFLLSDLTTDCAIFLKRNSNGRVFIEKNREIKTFATRISDLFEDGFSLDSGLIGKFAKNKLNNTITDIINSTDISSSDKIPLLTAYKSIIGDKLISYQLEKIIERLEVQND